MDAFDELVRQKLPTRETILSRIDEYTLYCFYTEITDLIPGKPVSSPIRDKDENPSFVVFPSNGGNGKYSEFEFTWYDQKLGMSGNIFSLIKLMYGLRSFDEVYALISRDFELDLLCKDITVTEKVCFYEKPDPVEVSIKIHPIEFTERGLRFWQQFRIERDLLELYRVKQIDYYWSYQHQETPRGCPDPTFSYNVGGYYQIYSPHAPRKEKFRNNLPPEYFFGYLQLPPTGDKLIIDKSGKDTIFCRRLGHTAISGKSETTMIPPSKMLEVKGRFKRVFIMLDNDEAGRKQTDRYMKLYPWLEPRFLEQAKDKTDLCLKVGFDEASRIINQALE